MRMTAQELCRLVYDLQLASPTLEAILKIMCQACVLGESHVTVAAGQSLVKNEFLPIIHNRAV